ncbi:DUF2252 domain-containing protein [Cyanobium sp. HWJ4-Hawea]|uniref:DUF2252 domain-containing protein n=1 Tax=Cyanobium sp. HWJ4-Hawea TaxID=2823713 RepID=UPI0020CC86F7|nr:DUF2252 domain-containing protein [Cyanobium sp. HWJ4-Hawea]MCP9809672.1 DUF2252 domain-containing protein [Cyanobium sp. HWJ4-Hawea]
MSNERQNQRPDPIELLINQEVQRLPWLLPERHSRMAQSPFAFYRGTAAVMASDLGRQPHSGLMVQLCGDAHLMNFGFFASSERQLLFDINDFDETYPGPFEWDLQRLAASLILAARSLGLGDQKQQKICRRSIRAYGEAMANFAAMPFIEMYVMRLDVERLIAEHSSSLQQHLVDVMAAAKRRDSRQAVRKLCVSGSDGELRFRHDPPLIWRYEELSEQWGGGAIFQQRFDVMYEQYLSNIRPEMRRVMSQFRFVDAALKAVGVGSVGTRCAVGVLVGSHPDDVLVLQGKQAEPSVLAPYLPKGGPEHQGQRVVEGQRLMQTASDAFLGWTTTPEGLHIYWRHFRDWKGSVDVTCLDADGLSDYGRFCGWTLAKAHARSGDRRAISAHIGEPKLFAKALVGQALCHADQAEADYQMLLQAIGDGRLQQSGQQSPQP